MAKVDAQFTAIEAEENKFGTFCQEFRDCTLSPGLFKELKKKLGETYLVNLISYVQVLRPMVDEYSNIVNRIKHIVTNDPLHASSAKRAGAKAATGRASKKAKAKAKA